MKKISLIVWLIIGILNSSAIYADPSNPNGCDKTCTSLYSNCDVQWLGTNVTQKSTRTYYEGDIECPITGRRKLREVIYDGDARQLYNMRCYYSAPSSNPKCSCPDSFDQCGPDGIDGRGTRTVTSDLGCDGSGGGGSGGVA